MLIIRDGKFSLISSVVITNAAIKGNNCLNICEWLVVIDRNKDPPFPTVLCIILLWQKIKIQKKLYSA